MKIRNYFEFMIHFVGVVIYGFLALGLISFRLYPNLIVPIVFSMLAILLTIFQRFLIRYRNNCIRDMNMGRLVQVYRVQEKGDFYNNIGSHGLVITDGTNIEDIDSSSGVAVIRGTKYLYFTFGDYDIIRPVNRLKLQPGDYVYKIQFQPALLSKLRFLLAWYSSEVERLKQNSN